MLSKNWGLLLNEEAATGWTAYNEELIPRYGSVTLRELREWQAIEREFEGSERAARVVALLLGRLGAYTLADVEEWPLALIAEGFDFCLKELRQWREEEPADPKGETGPVGSASTSDLPAPIPPSGEISTDF